MSQLVHVAGQKLFHRDLYTPQESSRRFEPAQGRQELEVRVDQY